jgi:sulfite exporter TauE/SafE
MLSDSLLLAALAAGFFGSPHCLGMCGGIVTAFGLSMQPLSAARRGRLIAAYHVGRLTSYASLGIIAGGIGATVLAPLAQTFWPRGVIATVLLLLGLSMLGLPLFNRLEVLGAKLWQALAPLRARLFPLHTLPRALAAGLLWGFLPCGLVYGALLLAMSAHQIIGGGVLMLAFGLGTLPMLLLTHSMTQQLRQTIGHFKLRQINGIILIIAGFWMLSPLVMQHGTHAHPAMSMTENHLHRSQKPDAMMHQTTAPADMPMDMQQMDHMNHSK